MITKWNNDQEPQAPYYAVIFISTKGTEREGYAEMDDYLMNKAQNWEGFLGYSSVGNEDKSIFISYWKDKESISSWRDHDKHLEAKSSAKQGWYAYYHSLVCVVESSSTFIEKFVS